MPRNKETLPSIISRNQTDYVKNRFICESGRLTADIINVCDKENGPDYLLIIDTEKVFDSLDHNFLICILRKFVIGDNFIKWVKVLLDNQESFVSSPYL